MMMLRRITGLRSGRCCVSRTSALLGGWRPFSDASHHEKEKQETANQFAQRKVIASEEWSDKRVFLYKVQENQERIYVEKQHKSLLDATRNMLHIHFLPVNYPHSVTPDYMNFVYWQTIQGICSSITRTLSTQAMLVSGGLSPTTAIGSGIVINYVLKDLFGMVGRILIAGKIANRFDSHPKQWRLAADVMFNLACALELTLIFLDREYFLIVASLSSVVKAVCWMCGTSTKAAIHRSFVLQENFGDVAAKADAQLQGRSIAGTTLGILLSVFVGLDPDLIVGSFLGLSSIHIFANYQSVRSVNFKTLNEDRLWMLVNYYIYNTRQRPFLRPEVVNQEESILSPLFEIFSGNMMHRGLDSSLFSFGESPRNGCGVILGASLSNLMINKLELVHLISTAQQRRELYLIHYNHDLLEPAQSRISVILHPDAASPDIVQACLHACYLRKAVLDGNRSICLENDAYRLACDNVSNLSSQMEEVGWMSDYLHTCSKAVRIKWELV